MLLLHVKASRAFCKAPLSIACRKSAAKVDCNVAFWLGLLPTVVAMEQQTSAWFVSQRVELAAVTGNCGTAGHGMSLTDCKDVGDTTETAARTLRLL